jgi:hypothetical protein
VLSYHNQHLFANNRCLSVMSTQFIYSSSSNLLVKEFKRVEQWINRTKSFSGECSINPLFDEHDRTSINNQWMYSFSKRNESNKYLIEHNPFLVFVRLITCSTNTTGRKILLGLCTSSHYFLLLQRTKKPTMLVWQDWPSRTRN